MSRFACGRRRLLQLLGVSAIGAGTLSKSGGASASNDEAWSKYNYSTRGENLNPNITGPEDVSQQWDVEVSDLGQPVTDGELLYLPGNELIALDTGGGESWSTLSGEDWRFITVDDQRVYASTGDVLVATDKSGDVLWEQSLSLDFSTLLPDGDDVYVISAHQNQDLPEPGVVSRLDATTGERVWEQEVDGIWYIGVTDGEQLYLMAPSFSEEPAEVVALDAGSGAESWRQTLENSGIGSVAVVDGQVFTVDANIVYAFDARDGTVQWRDGLQSPRSIAVGETLFHVTFQEGDTNLLASYVRETGDLAYVEELPFSTNFGAPQIVGTNDRLYVYDFEGDWIGVVDRESGEVVNEIEVPAPTISIIPTENELYIGSENALFGMSGEDSSSSPDPSEADEQVIVGPNGEFFFDPAELQVDPGTTVAFVWDSEPHNVVVQNGPSGGWEGHHNIEETGFVYEHTFEVEGVYEYICEPHIGAGMEGVIVVGDSASGDSDEEDDTEGGNGTDEPDNTEGGNGGDGNGTDEADDEVDDTDEPDDADDESDESSASNGDENESAEDDGSGFTDAPDDSQPAPGVVGTLASIGGAGYLLKRRFDPDESE